MSTSSAPTRVSSWLILRVWLALSLQSFGGGGATLTLIRRAVVDQQGWVTDEEFVRDWAICQIAPGINLIALCILIGRRIAGWRGVALCLFGMLFPSAVVTIIMTGFYARVRDTAIVRHALRAIIPASVGLGLYTSYEMARSPLKESWKQGKGFFLFGFLLIASSGVAMFMLHPPVVLILLVAGLASASLSWIHSLRSSRMGEEASQ